jgi:uncharacterized membrane protein
MNAILPLVVAFVCGALLSLAKEGTEGKTNVYWRTLLVNSVLLFCVAIITVWYLQQHMKSLEPMHKFFFFLAAGIASNMFSDVLENTENEIETKKLTVKNLVTWFRGK